MEAVVALGPAVHTISLFHALFSDLHADELCVVPCVGGESGIDENVEKMMSHLERRREVPSTFGELVRSDRDRGEAVNSIKRIEDSS